MMVGRTQKFAGLLSLRWETTADWGELDEVETPGVHWQGCKVGQKG